MRDRAERDPGQAHRPSRWSRSSKDTDRNLLHVRRRGEGVRDRRRGHRRSASTSQPEPVAPRARRPDTPAIMKKRIASPHPIRCSFCGRGQDEVARLVSGPSVYICSECVKLCNDILEGEIEREQPSAAEGTLPKPAEIKKHPRRLRDRPGPRQEDALGGGLQPLQAHLLAAGARATSSSRSRTSC